MLNRILGRVRNMLTLPSGDRTWPVPLTAEYTAIAPVTQFQMVQRSVEIIEMKLVTKRPLTSDEEGRLRTVVQKHLGHPFEIEFTYHDDIPRGASGKFEDFRSELS